MPIYEYICDDCETSFERIVLNRAQEIACPKCASKKNTIQLSVFSASIGNGSGNGNGAAAQASPMTRSGGGCCGGGCGCH